MPYGTGSYNQINGSQTARRLMNLFGGCLGIYNSYSWAAINTATPTVYGTLETGSQRQDWLNARYILMWGWNPAEMRDGTNSDYFVKLARQNGARVVCIDPRMSMSAVSLADEWIPIRPGTDTAMMSAMAYVMVTEGLYEAEFVRTHCVGFDESQMPAGAEGLESYRDYLLGKYDGQPKTPEWAEADHNGSEGDHRTDRPGICHAQARGAVPRLRHAAPRLWRAGGAGGLRAGGADRQCGAAGELGERAGIAGAGRRAVLAWSSRPARTR